MASRVGGFGFSFLELVWMVTLVFLGFSFIFSFGDFARRVFIGVGTGEILAFRRVGVR